MAAKKSLLALVLFISLSGLQNVFAQSSNQNLADSAFVQGTVAYRKGEWMSAVFLLRKAVSYPQNYNADTFYMLISAEMYAGEYKSAFQDCELFLQKFFDSSYVSYVTYQKGKALYCLGEYEKSVLLLSDFCHQYPDHEMYASALYWIAEAFYASYNYDEASVLYRRIIADFPNDAKAAASQFRLETIAQSYREEKLLYLLKETGEEYLAAKEEYERQLRLSGSESAADARRRILDLQRKNADLENKNLELTKAKEELEKQLEEVQTAEETESENDTIIQVLKEKAWKTQQLLNERRSSGRW
ncbi:MAG: tetratricopeptide repeat protein [Treponema sp.]|nr:tetratricopeptide repeat protein [Treponema sp.]